ncbi:MAG TPA: hypothetical protein VNO52_09595 [Methylomirabilota bacterium]|nr:hypothetical protein [Methylomirabilota bacterium]
MKNIFLLALGVLLAGCAGRHPRGVSQVDPYDGVRVDQMLGNHVSGAVFQKTIVCLNARRETRAITAVTNQNVTVMTNQTVQATTNQIISTTTNYVVSAMTNLAPIQPVPATLASPEGTAAVDAGAVAAVTNSGPAITTNVTTSLAQNHTATAGPNQLAATHQAVRSYNNQITTQSNNLLVSLMTNLVVIFETNATVSFATNVIITAVTNWVIVPTNQLAHDYFLSAEFTPPPDFTLQSGESLVLLVDGIRHGFVQAQSSTVVPSRRGFTTVLYRVTPEQLVDLANAREVRMRLKGTSSVIERELSATSRRNFRAFLLKYLGPTPAEAPEMKAASVSSTALANR